MDHTSSKTARITARLIVYIRAQHRHHPRTCAQAAVAQSPSLRSSNMTSGPRSTMALLTLICSVVLSFLQKLSFHLLTAVRTVSSSSAQDHHSTLRRVFFRLQQNLLPSLLSTASCVSDDLQRAVLRVATSHSRPVAPARAPAHSLFKFHRRPINTQ